MVFGIQSRYLPVFPLSQVVTMFTPRADTRGRPHRKPKRAGPRDARAQLSAPGAEAQPGTPAPHPLPGALPPAGRGYLRSSPTFRMSHSILVSSMLLRPKGHSCLSSRLLFSSTICRGKGNRSRRDVSQREGQRRWPPREGETGHDRGSAGRSAGRGTRMLARPPRAPPPDKTRLRACS